MPFYPCSLLNFTLQLGMVQLSSRGIIEGFKSVFVKGVFYNLITMHCNNCGAKVKADAKFCVSCGTKVAYEEQKVPVAQSFGEISLKMKEHLEFLGYSFEVIKPTTEKGKPILLGKHASEYKLFFWEIKDDIILFGISLTAKTKASPALYEFANNANLKYLLARALIENAEPAANFKSEALWTGEYSKDRFGAFVDQIKNDLRQLNSIEGFDKLL